MLAEYKEYVNDVEMPIIAEFLGDNDVAIKYGINKDNLYDWPEFNETTERAARKMETYLIRSGLGTRNAAMNIFLLKQPNIGYKDRFEQDVTSDGEKVQFINAVTRPAKDPKKSTATP